MKGEGELARVAEDIASHVMTLSQRFICISTEELMEFI